MLSICSRACLCWDFSHHKIPQRFLCVFTYALREKITQLEVLVGGHIDGGDTYTVFNRLQTLIEEVLRVNEQLESSNARRENMAKMVDHLRAELEMECADVALKNHALLNHPQQGNAHQAAKLPRKA